MHYTGTMSVLETILIQPDIILAPPMSLGDGGAVILPENPAIAAEMQEKLKLEAEAKANLGTAQMLVAQIESLKITNPAQAQLLLNQLQALPLIPGTSSSAAMASAVQVGLGDQAEINTAQAQIDAENAAAVAVVSERMFKEAERHVLHHLSKDLREAIVENFSASSYKAVDIVRTTENGKEVLTTVPAATISGEQAREAVTEVAEVTVTGQEGAKQGRGDDVTPEEGKRKREHAKLLTRKRAAEIMDGPGTKEEKQERLQELEKSRETFERDLTELEKAQRQENKALRQAMGGARSADVQRAEERLARSTREGLLRHVTSTHRERQQAHSQEHHQEHGQQPEQSAKKHDDKQQGHAPAQRQSFDAAHVATAEGPMPTPGMGSGGRYL